MIEKRKTKPNCSDVKHWHIGTYDERRRDRPGNQSQFSAGGRRAACGCLETTRMYRRNRRNQRTVFPFLFPLTSRLYLLLNLPGGTPLAGSLLVVRLITLVLAGWGVKLARLPTASTTHAPPLRGPGPARPVLGTKGDPPCSFPPWPPGPRQGWAAGSDRFWLLELRVF